MGKRFLVVILSICVSSLCLSSVADAAEDTPSFRYPLNNKTVVKKFVAPATQYSSGHRGADFSARAGTSVFSVADGRVIFAGFVAGGLHVSIDHGNNVVSTSTYMKTKTVSVGQNVRKGQPIGTTSTDNPNEPDNVFHFSLRVKGNYVDPIAYLNGRLEPRKIYLAPLETKSESFLDKVMAKERNALEKLLNVSASIEPGLPSELIDRFNDAFRQSLPTVQKYIDDVFETLEELKNATSNIRELEKKLIRQAKKAFAALLKYSRDFVDAYKHALRFGIEAGKWFLERYIAWHTLIVQLSTDLALGLKDFVDSAVIMTSKMLRQYVEVDIPMILRVIIVPQSCLANACTNPITVKCNPFKGYSVKKKSDYRGSGNDAFLVGGINTTNVNSDGDFKKPTGIDYETLGYDSKDVSYFSYAGQGKSYNVSDTFQDLKVSAKKMDEQIRHYARTNPGKKLDILTHSLGGAVTGLWLAMYYDPDSDAYPRLGHVVMYAPPLAGTSLSSAADLISSRNDGEALRNLAGDKFPFMTSDSVNQVSEGGEVADIMNQSQVAKKVKIYTIRDPSDIVVSTATQPVKGVEEIVVNDHSVDIHPVGGAVADLVLEHAKAHNSIMSNKKSLSTVQSILIGQRPPCERGDKAIQSVVRASFVHATEVTLGRSTRDVSDFVDIEKQARFINSYSVN